MESYRRGALLRSSHRFDHHCFDSCDFSPHSKKGGKKVECFNKGTSTFDLIETIAPREQKEARESGETEQWYDTSSVGEEMMVVEEEPTTFDLQESSPPGQEEIPTSSV